MAMAMATSVVSSSSSSLGFSASAMVSSGSNVLQASPSVSCPTRSYGYPAVFCGRGDKRTAKGKRFKGSFGNSRPKNKAKGRGLPAIPLPPRPFKKDPFEDGEKIEIDIEETMLN